jgi:pimeloyl-ACP methyl ester carboxylesterase
VKSQQSTKKRISIGVTVILVVIFSAITMSAYFHDLQLAYRFVHSGSKIIKTPVGTIEYTTYGTGKPVLISHGAGGGFDQGMLISKILGKDYRFIIPSRFGYLRSKTSHPVTARLQAEAYSYIVRDLGISKVSVVGFSAGGPSALSFAAHYPDFCENLIMMSAISAAISNSKNDPIKTVAFKLLYKSNFLYWCVTKVFHSQLLSLYGLDNAAQQKLSASEKKQVADLIYTTMPVSLREPGVLNDQKMILPDAREVETIKVPALIFHVRQDPLISFRNAEYTHRHIPGSMLVSLDNGGHFLMGHHQAMSSRIRAFIYR